MKKVKKKKSRARKTTLEPVRVYRYHVELDAAAAQKHRSVVAAATDYYNDRVAIENGRRDAFRRLRAAHHPLCGELETKELALEEELEEARVELKAQRRRARARVDDDALAAKAKAVVAQLKELRKKLSPVRKEANEDPRVRAAAAPLNVLGKELFENMRHLAHGPYWPTMGLTDRAFQQASGSSPVLRRRRFSAEGLVGGQLGTCDQPTVESVFDGTHKWLQIDRAAGKITTGRLRVGSVGRDPEWMEFSVLLHRPLPATGIIKNAWVSMRQQGNRRCYELQLVIESAEFFRRPATGPATAVAVGFRRLPDGSVHVATAVDVNGEMRSLVLPVQAPVGKFRRRKLEGDHDRIDQADRIRSASDVCFDQARDAASSAIDDGLLPRWFVEGAQHRAKWRSHRKLARLVGRLTNETWEDRGSDLWRWWLQQRKRAGQDLYAPVSEVTAAVADLVADDAHALAFYLEVWRRKNHHLYQVESDLRAKYRSWRKDLFACWVKQLGGRRLLLSAKNLAGVTRKENPEDEQSVHSPMRKLRAEAAPGRLAEMLVHAGAEKVDVGKEAVDGYVGIDTLAERCCRVLEVAGEDTAKVRTLLSEQRAALAGLRGMSWAAE